MIELGKYYKTKDSKLYIRPEKIDPKNYQEINDYDVIGLGYKMDPKNHTLLF